MSSHVDEASAESFFGRASMMKVSLSSSSAHFSREDGAKRWSTVMGCDCLTLHFVLLA